MQMPIVVEKPTYPAVSLEEAKKHLDVADFNDDDDQIASLILAATEHLEKTLGICLRKTKFQQNDSGFFGPRKILIYPVIDIERIELVLEDGSKTTLPNDSYELFTTHDGYYVYDKDEQPKLAKQPDAVKIFFTAGFEQDQIPATLKTAILLHCASLYENREDLSITKPARTGAYDALILPWRRPAV